MKVGSTDAQRAHYCRHPLQLCTLKPKSTLLNLCPLLRAKELRSKCRDIEWVQTSSPHASQLCIGSTIIETCSYSFVCCHLSYQVLVFPQTAMGMAKECSQEAALTHALLLPHLDPLNTPIPRVSWRRMGIGDNSSPHVSSPSIEVRSSRSHWALRTVSTIQEQITPGNSSLETGTYELS